MVKKMNDHQFVTYLWKSMNTYNLPMWCIYSMVRKQMASRKHSKVTY